MVIGYFADKGRDDVASQDVTMDSKVGTVTYTKFGKIIAVDEKGIQSQVLKQLLTQMILSWSETINIRLDKTGVTLVHKWRLQGW